ncbi:MAG: hypothetical protein M1839_008985 [Geoglossum umbratile]|nr:MAG: hypothetical protein M1839_008985 [Geoglossum umbratile]
MAPQVGLSFRLRNLPAGTTESDIRRYLGEFPGIQDKHIKKVSKPCPYSSLAPESFGSVITLQSQDTARVLCDNITVSQRPFLAERSHGHSIAVADTTFLDLTTLYCSANAPDGVPNVDILAVHGLMGHGYNSWVHLRGTSKNPVEVMWLKDILPEILEAKKVYPRIMIYGYRSNIFVNTNAAKIDEPATNLYNCLNAARQDTTRPLYFFAHSLGGIVIKQTISLIDEHGLLSKHPIKGCVFFGTPHHGSASAERARAFLEVMTTLIQGNSNIIKELSEKSQKLVEINGKFLQVRYKNGIEVLSCFEQVALYGQGKIVTRESATLDFTNAHEPFPIDANHTDMIKFASASQQGFEQVVSAFVEIATRPPSRPKTQKQPCSRKPLENKLKFLSKYDTVFFIDDSGSMGSRVGPEDDSHTRWDQAREIFMRLVPLALQYDRDGIDIHFLNTTEFSQQNITSTTRVQYLFSEVEPDGDTPIGFELEGFLKDYLRKLERSYKGEERVKPLNLIILTDGEPDDLELLDRVIVNAARKIQELGARDRQIGIQFVQIGDEDEATRFLKRLDDDLGIKNQTLDIVDTVKYDPKGGDEMIMKILLGAIKDDFDSQSLYIGVEEKMHMARQGV